MKSVWEDNLKKLAKADLKLEQVAKSVQECQLRIQELQREQQLALVDKRDAQAVITALQPVIENS